MAEPYLYTLREAGERLRLQPGHLRRLIRRGRIKAVRPTGGPKGKLFITPVELERLLTPIEAREAQK